MNEALCALVIGCALAIGAPTGMFLGHIAGRLTRAHDHHGRRA